jgi:hypothetical protein
MITLECFQRLDQLAAEVTRRLGEDTPQKSCYILFLGRAHLDEKLCYSTATLLFLVNSWTANVHEQKEQIV